MTNQRNRTIDLFRGLAIILMIFFSLLVRLSITPDILSHNVRGSIHFGDFVLPMFLFASGLSLPFFIKRREVKKPVERILDVIEKFGKLILISLIITPFSAGGLLYMDEIMLNAVLFLPAVILAKKSEEFLLVLSVVILLSYFLIFPYIKIYFDQYYLGGYYAAIFYLPVMLAGVLLGKRIIRGKEFKDHFIIYLALTISSLLTIFPDKMQASPSFMVLSILLSIVLFYLIKVVILKIKNNPLLDFLEYCGKEPLRFWVTLFLIFVIPISFYLLASGKPFPLGLEWKIGVLVSAFAIILSYFISKLIDFLWAGIKLIQ